MDPTLSENETRKKNNQSEMIDGRNEVNVNPLNVMQSLKGFLTEEEDLYEYSVFFLSIHSIWKLWSF